LGGEFLRSRFGGQVGAIALQVLGYSGCDQQREKRTDKECSNFHAKNSRLISVGRTGLIFATGGLMIRARSESRSPALLPSAASSLAVNVFAPLAAPLDNRRSTHTSAGGLLTGCREMAFARSFHPCFPSSRSAPERFS